jgi:hypothetical protein
VGGDSGGEAVAADGEQAAGRQLRRTVSRRRGGSEGVWGKAILPSSPWRSEVAGNFFLFGELQPSLAVAAVMPFGYYFLQGIIHLSRDTSSRVHGGKSPPTPTPHFCFQSIRQFESLNNRYMRFGSD